MSDQGRRLSVHRSRAAIAIAFLLAVGCSGAADHQVRPSTAYPTGIGAIPEPIEPCRIRGLG